MGYIAGGGHDKRILFGAFLELLLIIANIGTAVVIVPIMRRQFEELSIGYVTARLFECTFILVPKRSNPCSKPFPTCVRRSRVVVPMNSPSCSPAFDVVATYDKDHRKLRMEAVLTPELVPSEENPDRLGRRSGKSSIAGAGFEPATSGL